jgi:GT2 family glycosyltransferase
MFDAVSPGTAVDEAHAPRVTVAFLLYNAAARVPALVDGLTRQRHPTFPQPAEWMRAVFVDDASADGTAQAVRRELEGRGGPAHCRLVAHTRNLGLAATLNELFAEASTPFVLTCHLDCSFGRDDYVAAMLELIEKTRDAAAITGQPTVPGGVRLPLAEKLNVVANMMDVVPDTGTAPELVPVGFAEGRCDIFRVAAIREVGLYDTRLRTSGEDQVLAAKLRARGYEIYKAPRLHYVLSVSAEQDSVAKLLRHQHLFGRTTPYIVLSVPGSLAGLVGRHAGANRSRRTLLRLCQLVSTVGYGVVVLSLWLGWPGWLWAGVAVGVVALKVALFSRHARTTSFSARELLVFALLQPAFDVAYAAGIVAGLVDLALGRSRPIG